MKVKWGKERKLDTHTTSSQKRTSRARISSSAFCQRAKPAFSMTNIWFNTSENIAGFVVDDLQNLDGKTMDVL